MAGYSKNYTLRKALTSLSTELTLGDIYADAGYAASDLTSLPATFDAGICTEYVQAGTAMRVDPARWDRIAVNGERLADLTASGASALLAGVGSLTIALDDGAFSQGDEFSLCVTAESTAKDPVMVYYRFAYMPGEAETAEYSGPTSDTYLWDLTGWTLEFTPDNDITLSVSLSDARFANDVHVNSYSAAYIISRPDGCVTVRNSQTGTYLRVNPLCPDPFTITVSMGEEANGTFRKESFDYVPFRAGLPAAGTARTADMSGPFASHALLRADPKLTGNIKVVVGSDQSLYLDTFKVSPTLGYRKYRHIRIGGGEYYGRSLMSKFASIPTTDLYGIEGGCYGMLVAGGDLSDQYYDTYRAGVRTNADRLYPENFALLAPLRIRESLPDFFLVLRVDKSSMDEDSMTDTEIMKACLRDGTLVKSYDFREGSELGTFARGVLSEARKAPGDVYVAYDDRTENRFNGISLERGAVASLHESVFPSYDATNQVALNDFLTEGFERNRLVSKDVVNFEYMFDDAESKMLSINTYVGLYVRLNREAEGYSCIGKDADGYNMFDATLATFPKGTSLPLAKTGSGTPLSEIIYGFEDSDGFHRLSTDVYSSAEIAKRAMRLGRCSLSSRLYRYDPGDAKSFATVRLNAPLSVGEHLRAVDFSAGDVFEVIASNCADYASSPGGLSDLSVNYCDGARIARVSMYVGTGSTAEGQAASIFRAFGMMSGLGSVTACSVSGASVSLVCSGTDAAIERICPTADDSYGADVSFFGAYVPGRFVADAASPSCNRLFVPHGAEFFGPRTAYAMMFMPFADTGVPAPYIGIPDTGVMAAGSLAYVASDGKAALAKPFALAECDSAGRAGSMDAMYVQCCGSLGKWFVPVSDPSADDGMLSFYALDRINDGICSILQARDYDFDVMDTATRIRLGGNDAIGTAGAYSYADDTFNIVLRPGDEERFRHYMRRHDADDGAFATDSELEAYLRDAYYGNLDIVGAADGSAGNATSSDISLLAPHSCKWDGIASDARGEAMRLMYDFTGIAGGRDSYYIPDASFFDASYGYMYDASADGPKKISASPGSIVGGGPAGTTLKDSILSGNGSLDDILIGSGSPSAKASVAYASGSNTLEFVSCGVRFRIRSSDESVLSLDGMSGYKASFVTVPGSNPDHGDMPTELIVDEDTKELMLAWYRSSDSFSTDGGRTITRLGGIGSLDGLGCEHVDGLTYAVLPYKDPPKYVFDGSKDNIYLSSIPYGSDGYTKENAVTVTGVLDSRYGANEGAITFLNPYLQVGDAAPEPLDANSVAGMLGNYSDAVEGYIISDSLQASSGDAEGIADAFSSCATALRKNGERMDLTGISGLLTVDVVEPYAFSDRNVRIAARRAAGKGTPAYRTDGTARVHPAYYEPATVGMLGFEYSLKGSAGGSAAIDVDAAFGRSFNGANVSIDSVMPLTQTWIRKCSDDPAYAIAKDMSSFRLSIDVVHGESIMKSPWKWGMYRKYSLNSDGTESFSRIAGYESGCETCTFFGSRGIVLNGSDGRTLEVTVWKHTKVSSDGSYVRLDVTDSVVALVMANDAFSRAWKYLGLSESKHKTAYVRNAVMSHININNATKFALYRDPGAASATAFANGTRADAAEVANFRSELKSEGGKQYLYAYPGGKGTYRCKMTIVL